MNFNGDIISKVYAPIDIGTTYTLSSDDIGIYIKDDKTNIKQYIKWYNVTEEEYVDIFNNIDDYKDASEVLW
jgi:hypothetical protein